MFAPLQSALCNTVMHFAGAVLAVQAGVVVDRSGLVSGLLRNNSICLMGLGATVISLQASVGEWGRGGRDKCKGVETGTSNLTLQCLHYKLC